MSINHLYHVLMAAPAGRLCNLSIALTNADGLMKMSRGHGPRMVESIERLGPIFSKEGVGGMTAVARGYRTVTGFEPGIIVELHDMTVGTGGWIIS
jgi:hypothetical protein